MSWERGNKMMMMVGFITNTKEVGTFLAALSEEGLKVSNAKDFAMLSNVGTHHTGAFRLLSSPPLTNIFMACQGIH